MGKNNFRENKYWIEKLAKEGLDGIEANDSESQRKLGEVQSRIDDVLKDIFHQETTTVKSVLQGLYDWTKYDFSNGGQEEVDQDVIKDCFFGNIDLLANLLGIELED